ncbi:hypothetical protein L2E82_06399 [Cichorium intybus]|uniref:Uncharacterized protein n=1 Tax=Cichorium intybus TaxID=13427 RepID=A0ACB9H9X0_CICIN|nr:hypothetical protein L2E82_06399 [Cichorium intybus]
MATNKRSIILFVAVVAAIATSVSSKEFIVGDDKGWTLNFDYQAWAYGKEFVVGDKLVFKYAAGKHNLFRVNGTVFQQCMIPPSNEALTSGYDVITLATPGRKWYICGVGKHCELGGMKLFINVLPQSTPPTPVSPAPSGKVFVVGDEKGWTLNFDYQAWAMGKEFVVGDKLVFRYPTGKHNVFRVNGTSFQQCTNPVANEALTSGYDVISLETPGRKWYICGVGNHCELGGMKLFINVLPRSMAPTPVSPAPSGKFFVVGDDKGWTLNFDYQAWAMGKQFVVGDKLVFRYPVGKHNVFRVNGTSFQQCTIPAANEALTSGYDVISLETPGRKWYICGVGKHCLMGLKLFINVLPHSTYPPPPPYYGARKLAPPKF